MTKKSFASNRFYGFTAGSGPWYVATGKAVDTMEKTEPCAFLLSKVRFHKIEVTRSRSGHTEKAKRDFPHASHSPWQGETICARSERHCF